MQCRAMQTLHLLSLDPIAESIADKNAYGFRPMRSAADAIERCFITLSRRNCAQYILEGDIRACFDNISHQWLLKNTPMDKGILKKWLAAGYIEKGKLHPTELGAPQGGSISPTLLTITLSGLEQAVKTAVRLRDKVNVCVYADDFIITGGTKEVLENRVKPAVEAFLSERGLSLSQEKTKITHIDKGFDFLGMSIRKYNGKLIIKPAKSSVKRLLTNIRMKIKSHKTVKTEYLIHLLNPMIRGWTNYHCHVCSKATFSYVDSKIFQVIWRWCVRRHPNKGVRWVKDKYFRSNKLRNWIFSEKIKDKHGKSVFIDLIKAAKTVIKRHIKIRSAATPYDPDFKEYFEKRIENRKEIEKYLNKNDRGMLRKSDRYR